MGATQILKLVFFGLIVILAMVYFVLTFILGKSKNINYSDKKTRIILRTRVILFIVMLILLFVILIFLT